MITYYAPPWSGSGFYDNPNDGRTRRFLEIVGTTSLRVRADISDERIDWWVKIADKLKLKHAGVFSPCRTFFPPRRFDFSVCDMTRLALEFEEFEKQCRRFKARGVNFGRLYCDQETFFRPLLGSRATRRWVWVHNEFMDIARRHFPKVTINWWKSYNSDMCPTVMECEHPAYYSVTAACYRPLSVAWNKAEVAKAHAVACNVRPGKQIATVGINLSLGVGFDARGTNKPRWWEWKWAWSEADRPELLSACEEFCEYLAYSADRSGGVGLEARAVRWVDLYPGPWHPKLGGACQPWEDYWRIYCRVVLGKKW